MALSPHQTSPPWSPCPCQFSVRLVQFRLKPRLVGMKGGVAAGRGFQFIEHDRDIPRHADLIGPSPNVSATVT